MRIYLFLYCLLKSQQLHKCSVGKTLTNKCSSYILPIVISGVHTVVAAREDSLIGPVCWSRKEKRIETLDVTYTALSLGNNVWLWLIIINNN